MSDDQIQQFPDRLSVNPRSPFHNSEALKKPVGILLDGKERVNVEEYCISEGWIHVAVGTALDRRGNPIVMKFKGKVEPFYKV